MAATIDANLAYLQALIDPSAVTPAASLKLRPTITTQQRELLRAALMQKPKTALAKQLHLSRQALATQMEEAFQSVGVTDEQELMARLLNLALDKF